MVKEDKQKPETFTRQGMIIGFFAYVVFVLILIFFLGSIVN